MARTRILVVSPRYPYPPLRGDQRRVSALSEALAAHADVAVVAFGTGPPAPDGAVEVVPVQRTPMSVLRGNVACRNPWLPGQVRLFVDVVMRHAVLREIERRQPTVLHV